MLERPGLPSIRTVRHIRLQGWRYRVPCPAAPIRFPAMEHLRKGAATSCPSAQAEMEGAAVFAIIQGTATEPRAAYLDRLVPLTPEIAAHAAPFGPTEVFRLSAPCAAHRCLHFGDGRCSLASRLVRLAPPVVTSPPPCALRPNCMWWPQEGVEACLRCPQVVTLMYGASPLLMEAAAPPKTTSPSVPGK